MRSNPLRLAVQEALEPRKMLTGLVSFAPAVTMALGSGPSAVASADLTNNGLSDLVVANRSQQDLQILLSDGNGTFTQSQTLATGSGPAAIAVADLNGDGLPDIVVANENENDVSIFINDGNGQFTAKVTHATVSSPTSVAIADFNGDGIPDIVVGSSNSGQVGVLLGKGGGRFNAQTTFATSGNVSGIAVADFNGDGHQDVVAAISYGRGGASVQTLLGNGDGTFATPGPITLAGAYGIVGVSVGDFNGDGKPDVAFANGFGSNYGPATTGGGILLGNGDGSFHAPPASPSSVSFATGYLPSAVAVGDFNGDGYEDFLVVNGNGVNYSQQNPSAISVFSGDGDGTFSSHQNFPAGGFPSGVAVGDFTGDGKDDVAVLNPNTNSMSILLNNSVSPSITVNNGSVVATGSNGPDVAKAGVSNGNLNVQIDGLSRSIPLAGFTGLDLGLGAGDDSLTIGKDVPGITVGGGTGSDTIVAHNSSDSLGGGKGADLLTASGSADTVEGGKGPDTLASGTATGSDFMGGKGSDLFVNNVGAANVIDGGTGLNFASANNADTFANIFEIYNGPATASPMALPPAPADTIAGDITLDTLSTGVLKITGTANADSIHLGSDGVNLMVTANGSGDTLPLAAFTGVLVVGGAGDDSIRAADGLTLPVTLRGGAGNDTLTGGGGQCVLVGGAGSDSLTGGDAASLLVPDSRATFTNAPTGNDTLAGGSGTSYADFSHRTDDLTLSNNSAANSGDTAMGEATDIEASVKNIFGGTGNDTIVSTTPGSFLSAGYGSSSITSAGDNTVLTAGPEGAGSDSVTADGASNVLFLMNGHADTFGGTVASDLLQTDTSDV